MKRTIGLSIFALICVGAWLTAQYTPPAGGGGTGTVTSVATSGPITGGPFTTSGTIACATCVTSASSLTANSIVLGAGSQASAVLASLGTTTTVLHGNVSGAPSFGAVSLTADVTGVLPGANGGSGVANTGKTITIGGNFATSGAFTTTFTVTGNTNVTLPTSGTLSTTTGTVTTVGFTGGLITVANQTTTPAFTVAGTSGGIPYFDTSSTWASSAALGSTQVVLGGGAGSAPNTNSNLTYASGALTNAANSGTVAGFLIGSGTSVANYYSVSGGRAIFGYDGTNTTVGAATGHGISLLVNGSGTPGSGTLALFADSSGKIGIGGISAGFTYSLDVTAGGGNTARFFDQTATTGSTLVTITPGAGQTTSSTVLAVGATMTALGGVINTRVATGTNAYGLDVVAPTGATNNYAARFSNGIGVLITGGLNVGDITNPPIGGGLRFARTGTSNPFIVLSNQDGAVALSQVRGINGGGIQITDGTSANQWIGITSTGLTSIGPGAATYRLDVTSGTGTTARFFDQTATTGSTLVTITPGAAQSASSIVLSQAGSQSFSVVGAGLIFKSGTNARTGTGTLVGGTLAVANTSITANSQVFVQDTGGGVIANIGTLYVASQTASTGFTVTSSNAIDTSTFRYWIFETN